MDTGTYILGLHVKCLILTDFSQNLNM